MHTLTYTNNWWLETNQQPPTVTELNAFNQLYLLTYTWPSPSIYSRIETFGGLVNCKVK